MKNILASVQNFFQRLKLPALNVKRPQVQFDRARAIAIILIALFAAGNLWLILFMVVPAFTDSIALSKQVSLEQQNLLYARQSREESPEILSQRIASNQSIVQKAHDQLLDPAQLAEITNAIYQDANLAGIALTELAVSGGPEDKSLLKIKQSTTPTATLETGNLKPTTKPIAVTNTLTTSAAAPTPVPLPTMYQTRSLHLQAQGTTQRLLNFMARLRELQLPGAVVNTLDLKGKSEWATLNAEITLYLSLTPQNKQPPVQMIQIAAPPAPPPTATPGAPLQPPTPFVIVVPYGKEGSLPTITPTPERLYVYYVVSGDTLSILATRFRVTAQEIVNRNALTRIELEPGQKLLIPVRN